MSKYTLWYTIVHTVLVYLVSASAISCVLQCIPVRGTMSFTPHKFIKIAFQLACMATLHSFEFYFHYAFDVSV